MSAVAKIWMDIFGSVVELAQLAMQDVQQGLQERDRHGTHQDSDGAERIDATQYTEKGQ